MLNVVIRKQIYSLYLKYLQTNLIFLSTSSSSSSLGLNYVGIHLKTAYHDSRTKDISIAPSLSGPNVIPMQVRPTRFKSKLE